MEASLGNRVLDDDATGNSTSIELTRGVDRQAKGYLIRLVGARGFEPPTT